MQNGPLSQGQTYRVADLLPGLLDVDLVAPEATSYVHHDAGVVAVAPDPTFARNSLVLAAAVTALVPKDDHRNIEEYPTRDDRATALAPPVEGHLEHLAARPYAEVLQAPRDVTLAGVSGRAVDVRIGAMPPQARCTGAPEPCAALLAMPGFIAVAYPGESYRLTELDTPTGGVLVLQELETAGVPELIESLELVERPLPSSLSGARHVAYLGQDLVPGQEYAVPLRGAWVAFRVSSAGVRAAPVDDRELTLSSFDAGVPAVHLHVALTSTLRTAPDGTDAVALLGDAEQLSRPLPPGGMASWLAAQSWAAAADSPRQGRIAGRRGRVVTAVLGPDAPSADCGRLAADPSRTARRCPFVAASGSGELLYLDASRDVTVGDVDVDGSALTVVVIGEDVTGGTLRIVTGR